MFEKMNPLQIMLMYLIGYVICFGFIFQISKVFRNKNIENGWTNDDACGIFFFTVFLGSIFYPLFLFMVISFYMWKIAFAVSKQMIENKKQAYENKKLIFGIKFQNEQDFAIKKEI